MVEAVVAALIGSVATLLATALLAVLGFLVRKVWASETESVPNLEQRVQALEQVVHGIEDRPGHLSKTEQSFNEIFDRLDCIEEKIDDTRSKQEDEHRVVVGKIQTIVDVLQEHDINGHLDDV